jgi:hypothetical protein
MRQRNASPTLFPPIPPPPPSPSCIPPLALLTLAGALPPHLAPPPRTPRAGGLSLLGRVGIPSLWQCAWAIHPGGKAIINAFQKALSTLGSSAEGLTVSRDVLRQFGNMSSATIFFVLARVLTTTTRDDVFTAGFGPGLTIEFARLYRRGGGAASADRTAGGLRVGATVMEGGKGVGVGVGVGAVRGGEYDSDASGAVSPSSASSTGSSGGGSAASGGEPLPAAPLGTPPPIAANGAVERG